MRHAVVFLAALAFACTKEATPAAADAGAPMVAGKLEVQIDAHAIDANPTKACGALIVDALIPRRAPVHVRRAENEAHYEATFAELEPGDVVTVSAQSEGQCQVSCAITLARNALVRQNAPLGTKVTNSVNNVWRERASCALHVGPVPVEAPASARAQ